MPQLSITTDSDAQIVSSTPTTVGSSGTVSFVGRVGTSLRRSVLRFPAASLAGLTSSDIIQVIWQPYISVVAASAATFYFTGLDRDAAALDFNDMSWDNADQSGGVPWFTAGGDVDGGPASELVMPTGSAGLASYDVTVPFNNQLDNIGAHDYLAFLLLKTDETTVASFRFATLEDGTNPASILIVTVKGDSTAAGRNLVMWGDE